MRLVPQRFVSTPPLYDPNGSFAYTATDTSPLFNAITKPLLLPNGTLRYPVISPAGIPGLQRDARQELSRAGCA